MPSSSRTVLAKPSQPTRYCARTVSRRPVVAVAQRRGDATVVLHEAFQLDAMPQRHVRKRPRAVLQDRVEPGLRARHAALRADSEMGARPERRRPHAAELVALHVGHEHAVERPVGGKSPIAHLVDDAELAAELHGADADLQHLGGAELVLALLDQQRRDAAPAEIGRKRKPDRAAAGDQHRNIDSRWPFVHADGALETSGFLPIKRALAQGRWQARSGKTAHGLARSVRVA